MLLWGEAGLASLREHPDAEEEHDQGQRPERPVDLEDGAERGFQRERHAEGLLTARVGRVQRKPLASFGGHRIIRPAMIKYLGSKRLLVPLLVRTVAHV